MILLFLSLLPLSSSLSLPLSLSIYLSLSLFLPPPSLSRLFLPLSLSSSLSLSLPPSLSLFIYPLSLRFRSSKMDSFIFRTNTTTGITLLTCLSIIFFLNGYRYFICNIIIPILILIPILDSCHMAIF